MANGRREESNFANRLTSICIRVATPSAYSTGPMALALKTIDDPSTTTKGSQLQCAMAIAQLSRKGRSVRPAPIQKNHAISRDRPDGNADVAHTYDLSDLDNIELMGEYVVRLPKFVQGAATLVAAQSEILALNDTQLLILPRDSNGFRVGTQLSLLRRVDLIDIRDATNILGLNGEGVIAPSGVLDADITPALYTPWLDINNNKQLNRFGLVNGVFDGFDNLSEKWEGLALLPSLDSEHPEDFFLFVANDNDFATTEGFQAGQAYDAGLDIATTFLVWRVSIRQAQ
jgi:hypothetical protein